MTYSFGGINAVNLDKLPMREKVEFEPYIEPRSSNVARSMSKKNLKPKTKPKELSAREKAALFAKNVPKPKVNPRPQGFVKDSK